MSSSENQPPDWAAIPCFLGVAFLFFYFVLSVGFAWYGVSDPIGSAMIGSALFVGGLAWWFHEH